MRDEERTKEQLISELTQLRQEVARLDEAIKAAKEREDRLESKLKALLSTDREVGQEYVGHGNAYHRREQTYRQSFSWTIFL